ncbi:AbrB/MazE/SpoVT family DNA-binding domain-containing protein [Achromobacter spanius]|uniref:AbrB/MazE/SpoVT family DNA-binding domain-containing protein n=1 Tax=Achromobacter spanius TaxID=217203 RepID=UPI0036E7D900
MRVFKFGSGLALRLPDNVVDALNLKEGDDVEIQVKDDRCFEVRKTVDEEEALARLRKFRGMLPAEFIFNRDDANCRDR